jgi:hypothetical protein
MNGDQLTKAEGTPKVQSAISVCEGAAPDGAIQTIPLASAGPPRVLALGPLQSQHPDHCRTVSLPFATNDVQWLGALPAGAESAARLALTRDANGRVSGIEVESAVPSSTGRQLLPRVELLPVSSVSPVRGASRLKVQTTSSDVTIRCGEGDDPAAVALDLAGSPAPGARMRVSLDAEGDEGFNASLSANAGPATQGAPLRRQGAGLSAHLDVPTTDQSLQLTISCPARSAELRLTRAIVQAKDASPIKDRAAWVWEAAKWLTNPTQLIANARRHRLSMLYITVSIAEGRIAHSETLARFVSLCRAQGIAIAVVEGDPRMVTQEGLAHALVRAQALAAYQQAFPEAQLAAVQYDIEPYLLPAFSASPKVIWSQWAAALKALSTALHVRIDAVVPYWMRESPGGETALSSAMPAIGQLTIMAYRTDPAAVIAAAAPLLSWASANDVPATVALEAGPLGRDQREIFVRSSAGELHLVPLGDVAGVVLLSNTKKLSGGVAYRRSHAVGSDPARVTFAGRPAELFRVADDISTDLSAFPSAQRIAFHGLADLGVR